MIRTPSKKRYQEGQSLIEILFAMTIAVVAISTIAYVLFGVQVAVRQSIEMVQADALVKEGISAVKTIAQSSFEVLSPGVYEVQFESGEWLLVESSESVSKFLRTITLTSVDDEIYHVLLTVSWDVTPVRSNEVTAETYVSNWFQNSGDASDIIFETNSITYSATGTSIEDLGLENQHVSASHTLTDLKFEWDGSAELSSVSIDGQVVYDASTSGLVLTGDTFDIDDVVLPAQSGVLEFGPIVFTSDVRDTDLLMTSFYSDGSKRYMRILQ